MPLITFLVSLVISALLLELIGIHGSTNGTLAFIIALVITVVITLLTFASQEDEQRTGTASTESDNWYWERNQKRCRLCQGREGNDKVIYETEKDASEAEEYMRKTHGFSKQIPYRGRRCRYWHLTTER